LAGGFITQFSLKSPSGLTESQGPPGEEVDEAVGEAVVAMAMEGDAG